MLTQKFECVEPELGELLDTRPLTEFEPGLRAQLEAHLDVCHACRQRYRFSLEVERLMGEGVGVAETDDGRIVSLDRRLSRRNLLIASVLTLVAGLLLAILLGPSERALLSTNRQASVVRSSADDFRILRPHEGEILGDSGGRLEWTAVDGATSYRIELQNVETDFAWSRRVNGTSVALPDGDRGVGNYLAVIKPVPEDLTAEGERSVYFRRDDAATVLAYRLVHMPAVSLLALALGVAAGLLALRRR